MTDSLREKIVQIVKDVHELDVHAWASKYPHHKSYPDLIMDAIHSEVEACELGCSCDCTKDYTSRLREKGLRK